MAELSETELVMLEWLGEGYNFYPGQLQIDDVRIANLQALGLVSVGTYSQAVSWPGQPELEIRPTSGSVVKITSQGLKCLKERETT